MDLIAYRRERRRANSAAYSREYRKLKSQSRAPDSRAVGSALLEMMLDAYADRAVAGAPAELVDRLVQHGFDRHEAEATVVGMVERHRSMLTLYREAADARKSA